MGKCWASYNFILLFKVLATIIELGHFLFFLSSFPLYWATFSQELEASLERQHCVLTDLPLSPPTPTPTMLSTLLTYLLYDSNQFFFNFHIYFRLLSFIWLKVTGFWSRDAYSLECLYCQTNSFRLCADCSYNFPDLVVCLSFLLVSMTWLSKYKNPCNKPL